MLGSANSPPSGLYPEFVTIRRKRLEKLVAGDPLPVTLSAYVGSSS
jgi:hypothetical protein